MNILHIEDDIKYRERVRESLSEAVKPSIINSCDFDDYEKQIDIYSIDIIILDLCKDQVPSDREPGNSILGEIWEKAFCPIILFSAFADHEYQSEYDDNYFIRRVPKGKNEIERLISMVKELSNYINCKNEISKLLDNHIRETYKTAFPSMLKNIEASDTGIYDVFSRLMQRRIAAAIDISTDFSSIKPWEMYLYPPLSTQIHTADILFKKGEDKDNPEAYKIVLSPSCDLQNDQAKGRKPLKNILVAFCVNIELYSKSKGLPKETTQKKFNESLPKFLSNTNAEKYMPLPGLEGLLPHMACDFKQLEMIEYDKIGEDKEYIRVVSIDSPFREAITWAYMQVNCRPGLPNRDFELWTKQIWDKIKP